MINAVAGLLLGVYLLALIGLGNGVKFIDLIGSERGFIKWLVSVLIVYMIARMNDKIFAPMMGLVFLAMLLEAERQGKISVFFNDINKFLE